MAYVCDENSPPYYEGIYNALGECIHKDDAAKMVSFVFGWCSIACWVVAQIPQVVKSIMLKNVESVSPLLFINWFIGDISNLLGVIFTRGLVTQLASGSYYMLIDVICVTVNFYFRYCYKPKKKGKEKKHSAENEESEVSDVENKGSSVDSSDNSSAKSNSNDKSVDSSSNSSKHGKDSSDTADVCEENDINVEIERHNEPVKVPKDLVPVVIFLFLRGGMCYAVDEESLFDKKKMEFLTTNGVMFGELSEEAEEEAEDYTKTPIYIAGMVLGYISCVMYLAARLPQIIKNAKKHNVAGLAPAMFALASCANLFYAMSILLGSKTSEDYIRQVPWFLGSAGTLVFDATLLGQYFHYKKRAKYILVSEAATEENSMVSPLSQDAEDEQF